MKLNLEFYKEELYKMTPDEEKVVEYINTKNKEEYEDIVKKDLNDAVVLGLSNIRKNLVHAYDFKPNSVVLEIGAHLGEITGILCEKSQKVVSVEFNNELAKAIAKRHGDKENLEIIVGNLKEIVFEEKFDYITLFGVLEYAQKIFNSKYPALDLISYCANLLKPEGKLLIATDNKFALKSYVGDIDECTGITFDSITGYKSSEKTYKLGKNEIENILNSVGLTYYKFLYPLPDYKLPSLIFSDEYLPSSSKINGYFPYYKENSFVFFSEVDAYDTIVKEDKKMFPFFANSYFIEASKTEFKNDTKYVSFNNYRKEEYQLMTKIRETTVEKTYINEKSKKHINNMIENIKDLQNENIEIIDQEQEGKIVSKFIKGKLASQVISDNITNLEEILRVLNKYKETISKLATPYEAGEETILEKYLPDMDKSILPKLKYLKNGYWDMILKNCFIIDDKCVFFDQEWKKANVPMEFLLYRSIVNIEKIRNTNKEYELYEKLEIKEFIPIFEQLDNKIMDEVFDREFFNFYIKKHKNPIYENYSLQEENKKIIQEKEELENNKKELEKNKEELENCKKQLEYEIEKLNAKLNNIYESKSWKLARKLSKIKHSLKK